VSPRRSAAAALETRQAILDRAVDVASCEGLEGTTIGRLAEDLSMSKAGVIGHFGSKQALQLAALEEANAIFVERVWRPAADAEPGLSRLLAICEAWTAYLRGNCFAGGCFLTGTAAEFDARPGPVRDAIAHSLRRWAKVLANEARAAVEAGDLDADPEQVAFEIGALAAAANQAIQLHDDLTGADRALNGMRRVLGAS
jgi:AcrR family transcriptional regulator